MAGTTRVPVGIDSDKWVTVMPQRVVLAVVHNITTLTRLCDVLHLFESDTRVQVVATTSGTDPFAHGLVDAVADLGILMIAWEQATQTRFDLILSASHHGNLLDLHGPLAIMSHGVGYTKNSPGARSQEPGARSQEPGARSQEPGARSVFGLSPQWLLYDGSPIADALVLSHVEQVDRLRAAVPEVLHTAVVAGDPCYDRMRASTGLRSRYRNRFGVADGATFVVVSSTWSGNSLLGSRPDVLRRLLADLPLDSYRVAAIVHPNVWHGHGPRQVRTWLADCVRAGLVLVPELEGWRAALIAADCVIGDNGAVTCYGAALGRPVLLGAFPDADVAAGSPVAALGRLAPRLDLSRPLRGQVDAAIAEHRPDRDCTPVRDLVSSAPDESPQRLRELFYRLMDLPEPESEPMLHLIALDGITAPARVSAILVSAAVDVESRTVELTRYPAELGPIVDSPGQHLLAHAWHPGRGLRGNADGVFLYEHDLDGDTDRALAALLTDHPGATVAAVAGPGRCVVSIRDGERIELTGRADLDSTAWVSGVLAWFNGGLPVPQALRVTAGAETAELRLR